jgi:hypothetical protein
MQRGIVNLLKFGLALLVTGLCLEVYLRTTEISSPSFVMNDPVMGSRFRPNASTLLVQEGFYMGRISEQGTLGPSYPREKTPGVLRVALVGDSFVEAFQVFPRHSSRSVLEQRLTESLGREVQVINFGRSGLNLREMYMHWEHFVSEFNPDITLLVVTESSFIYQDNTLGPRLHLNGDEIEITYEFAQSDAYRMKERLDFLRNLGSFQMFQSALARYHKGATRQILFDKFAPRADRPSRKGTGVELPSKEEDQFFELNRAVLAEFGRINASGETKILLATHRQIPDYYREEFKAAGLEALDLRPGMERLKEEGDDPYYWEVANTQGHWNHTGNRYAGEALAAFVMDVLERQGVRATP